MKKGFTLVEVLVTLAILTVLLLIAVPVYINVQSGINESVYQSKIKEVLSKAEAFASETNRIVFDVETLIEEGDILADNEIGEYIDPRTGRDMRCDIIQLFYRNNRYEAIITESNICYDSTELEDLYGMVELELYDINDQKLEKIEGTDWQKENTIKVKYRVKDEYKKTFPIEVKKVLKDDFIIMSKEEVIQNKLYGTGLKNKYFDDALGDYFAIGIGNKAIRYDEKGHMHKSAHSGITVDEMLVPLIIYEGE